jgi:DNA integrity scanning protein DisA with diadenylate cyclase activity
MDDRDLLEQIRTEELGVHPPTIKAVILLAVELAREGREGRKVGTMFVVGDVANVLHRSTPLILDPLLGHPSEVKHIDDPNMRETVKELAQLDGAFVVSEEGVFISATRYINASSTGIKLPLGLGSRHMAAASVTKETDAAAVVVSESSTVRIFCNGEIVSEIIPELWLMERFGRHRDRTAGDDTPQMTVRNPQQRSEQHDEEQEADAATGS